MMERLTTRVVLEASINERIFDRFCMWRLVLLRCRLLLANKNPTEGPWWLELWHICGLRRFLREFPRAVLGLRPC
jgi:hypothetical protein